MCFLPFGVAKKVPTSVRKFIFTRNECSLCSQTLVCKYMIIFLFLNM